MRPNSIVNWFVTLYAELNLEGCPSHSGRRTFVTQAARLVHKAGGSLRDVQLLAGHRSIETTQRYIDGDNGAQRRLVGSSSPPLPACFFALSPVHHRVRPAAGLGLCSNCCSRVLKLLGALHLGTITFKHLRAYDSRMLAWFSRAVFQHAVAWTPSITLWPPRRSILAGPPPPDQNHVLPLREVDGPWMNRASRIVTPHAAGEAPAAPQIVK